MDGFARDPKSHLGGMKERKYGGSREEEAWNHAGVCDGASARPSTSNQRLQEWGCRVGEGEIVSTVFPRLSACIYGWG
jgi:hypothetical protein